MALPTVDPSWATSGGATKTDPGAAVHANGWSFGQIVPYDWLNYMFNAWWQFIDYFSDDISVGRDPAYGYKYSSPYSITYDLSPAQGWQDVGVQAVVLDTATGAIRATTAGVTTAIAKIPITPLLSGTPHVLTEIQTRTKATLGTITVRIKQAETLAGSAVTTLRTYSPTATAGFADHNDNGLSIDIPAVGAVVWAEIEVGTAGTITDTEWLALRLVMTKEQVEGD